MIRTIIGCVLVTALLFAAAAALGRDLDGRWAQSPNREYFKSLTDQNGASCCDGADGVRLEDPEWDMLDDNYWVYLEGERIKGHHGRGGVHRHHRCSSGLLEIIGDDHAVRTRVLHHPVAVAHHWNVESSDRRCTVSGACHISPRGLSSTNCPRFKAATETAARTCRDVISQGGLSP